MNRFRNKKKSKDDGFSGRPSHDGDTLSMPSFKAFRKGKKPQEEEEPKKEFDLGNALPAEDHFRTSLLMTNLSARFSMLREQDDPHTKIGKASDDSVLSPRRQSRLANIGHGGGLGFLCDIAEVESIKAPSSYAGIDSFNPDETDKNGSILGRAKPIEGNNLFGGRQKIYKIPAGGSSSTKNVSGMSGRALYDDDVALSAFQRWRKEEKERRQREAVEREIDEPAEEDQGRTSASFDTPQLTSYEMKRGTSSTTSSTKGRNSTAGNSVVSQPATSLKDWQSVSTAPTSVASTPAVERSATRTRRLYEQGLDKELHDHQSSALSRIDTLSRQRLGNRTPDLGSATSPSPTTLTFSERLGDRRQMLTKGSAPQLRSMSPPVSGSSTGAMGMNLEIRSPSQTDSKTGFGGSPPLSPPISETGEHPLLSIYSNDVGKATALGVFHKPIQPYDENKFAQRQLQLQQGRETPSQRLRTGSNASYATNRSQSSSSLQRQPLDRKSVDDSLRSGGGDGQDTGATSFLEDASPGLPPRSQSRSQFASRPQPMTERPSDEDHPAFRQSALPAALSGYTAAADGPPPVYEPAVSSAAESGRTSPDHSPTLGPTGPTVVAGLNGLVRLHLRSDSNTSSACWSAPVTAGLESRFPADAHRIDALDGLGVMRSPWSRKDHDWQKSHAETEPTLEDLKHLPTMRGDPPLEGLDDYGTSEEQDEFASQLADARRRVREKLTSFVESDSSRSGSPAQSSDAFPLPAHTLSTATIKPKSSRGSLVDRSKTRMGNQPKASRVLGLGAATTTSSTGPGRRTVGDREAQPPERAREEAQKERAFADGHGRDGEREEEKDEEDDANVHPGLRAFRQARRELQKRRELETLTRKDTEQAADQYASPSQPASRPRQRTPSRERKPPPAGAYSQLALNEETGPRWRPSEEYDSAREYRPRAESRADSRADSRAGNRPPPGRIRNGPTPDCQLPPSPARQHGLRSPGLPVTEIRPSPIMSPHAYPSGSASGPSPFQSRLDRSRSAGTLQVHVPSGMNSGQVSPISPLDVSGGFSPASRSTPGSAHGFAGHFNSNPSRNAANAQSTGDNTMCSSLNETHKRAVNKRDISEPTFVMSTSRVPTVNLGLSHSTMANGISSDHQRPYRPRLTSREQGGQLSQAPPLPPLNPRRKREGSRPAPMFDPMAEGRMGPEPSGLATPRPHFLDGAGRSSSDSAIQMHSTFSVNDDEDGSRPGLRRRIHKMNSEAVAMNSQAALAPGRLPDNSSAFGPLGPPASRSAMASRKPAGPGGLDHSMTGGMI